MFSKKNIFQESRVLRFSGPELSSLSRENPLEQKLEQLKENIMRNMKEEDFLSLSRETQFSSITSPPHSGEELHSGEKICITFHGNKLLERRITAQTLPEEIREITVEINGHSLRGKRQGITGEFYASNGQRLKIYEGTIVTVHSLSTEEETQQMEAKKNESVKKYVQKGGNEMVANVAYEKGVDPELTEVFLEEQNKDNEERSKKEILFLITEIGRLQGKFLTRFPNEQIRTENGDLSPEFVRYALFRLCNGKRRSRKMNEFLKKFSKDDEDFFSKQKFRSKEQEYYQRKYASQGSEKAVTFPHECLSILRQYAPKGVYSEDVLVSMAFIMQAETEGEKDRFIRTRIRGEVENRTASSAYGPVQITMSLMKDYAQRLPQLFTRTEMNYMWAFVKQGRKFLSIGQRNKSHSVYGNGGSGDAYFRTEEGIQLYFQVALKIWQHHIRSEGGDIVQAMVRWRGVGVGSDPRYYRGIFQYLRGGYSDIG
jgi:hypothetical protein